MRFGLALTAVSVAALLIACPPAAVLPTGCGKDTDCKGARICVRNACVDPPPARVVSRPLDGSPVDGGADDAAPDASAAVEIPAEPPPLGPSPMFHLSWRHVGRSPYKAPAAQPKEAMHVATGGVVFSEPAITGPLGASVGSDGGVSSVIVFGSHDKSIYGVTPDGTIKWRKPTQDLVWCSPALGPGGVVYVGSDDDRLYALDVADGTVRWTFTAGPCRINVGTGPEAARCDVDAVTVGPDGTVYASADGLYALRPDGTVRWKFAPGVTHCASGAAVGSQEGDGGTVFVGCRDHGFYALDPMTGAKRWEFRAGDDVDSTAAIAPDGTVYVGSDDHKLYAFLPGGTLRFALTTGGPVRASPSLGLDGTIYVGSFDGSVYAVRPSGVVAWTYRTADRILSSPLVDGNGLVLIGSEDDRLYALKPDGTLAWSLLLDGDVDATPALGPDGTIYIGSDDRALHALR